jgi:hypothetical protein
MQNCEEFRLEFRMGGKHLKDLGVDGSIILQLILGKLFVRVDRIGSVKFYKWRPLW